MKAMFYVFCRAEVEYKMPLRRETRPKRAKTGSAKIKNFKKRIDSNAPICLNGISKFKGW